MADGSHVLTNFALPFLEGIPTTVPARMVDLLKGMFLLFEYAFHCQDENALALLSVPYLGTDMRSI